MTGAPHALTPRTFWVLVALGLLLRLPGLFVNGMADDFEFVLDWGADVRALGLGQGLSRNYGAVSYGLFGLAAWAAEWIPRFWWLPLKAFEIAFELGILVLLNRLVTPSHERLVLVAYWLNPWFIWHGAYQGFWEGPHVLLGLAACAVLAAWRASDRAWAAAGALLFLSWQAKPQGLLHFALPLGLLLTWHALRGRRAPLVWYAAGLAAAALAVTLVLWMSGGPILALWHNFRSSDGDIRPSNGGPGLWRVLVSLYMWAHGVYGEVYTYHLPRWLSAPMIGGALLLAVGVLAALFWRVSNAPSGERGPTPAHAYLALAAGALVMSQFAPLAHINHSYGAMVLLIPLLPLHRRLVPAWSIGVGVLFYAHLSRYMMGSGYLPSEGVIARYGHAEELAAAIRATAAFSTPDFWLRLQASANHILGQLPGTSFVSVISVAMAAVAVVITAALFEIARSGTIPTLRSTR